MFIYADYSCLRARVQATMAFSFGILGLFGANVILLPDAFSCLLPANIVLNNSMHIKCQPWLPSLECKHSEGPIFNIRMSVIRVWFAIDIYSTPVIA